MHQPQQKLRLAVDLPDLKTVQREQEQIRSQPGGGIGEAHGPEAEALHKSESHDGACDELGEDGSFTGTATDLMATVKAAGQAGPEYAREIGNIARLRYALKQLARALPAVRRSVEHRIEVWTIPYKFAESAPEGPGPL